MPPKNDFLTHELAKNLELTYQLLHGLMQDLKEGNIDFVQLKTEVSNLVGFVEKISDSMDNSKNEFHQFKIDFAILKKDLDDLKTWSKEVQTKEQNNQALVLQAKSADRQGKWQFWSGLVTSVIALIGSIIALIIK